MSCPSVLCIEDEEDYQLLVRHILGKAGFDVHTASSGEQGLSRLEQLKPDLLVLDVNLPDADGYSLCKTLRQSAVWADLPVLMLTVRKRPEEWLMGFSAGADDYLPKPLNPPELIDRVQACLERRGAPEQRLKEEVNRSEYLLIRAAVAGNRAAFEMLVHQYRQRLIDSLRGLGNNALDAEDIASVAFVRTYEQLNRFRGQASFYTWLYRIAINEAQTQGRRKNVSLDKMTGGDEASLPRHLAEPDRAGEGMSQQMLLAHLRRTVTCVPRPYQQMLRWYFIRGLSCGTLARRLGIPRGTVMSRLFKAKQLLREAWNKAGSFR